MKKIRRRETPEIAPSLQDYPAILQRVYASRGITQKESLEKALKHLLPYKNLLHIDVAAKRLAKALYDKERVLIVGDFDADGATSSAVAVAALNALGVAHVDYLVPNRFQFGYGLTPEIVDVASQQKPDLIITVDNGIASHDGVAHAKSLGMDVLVTDHHLPGETLPDAIIVNPNQPGDNFESKSMAGVGVIFYVMLALRAELKQSGWFDTNHIEEPNMAQFLDLVALGTVADVVPLDKNNRILVEQGLKRIRAGLVRPGISALIDIAKRNAKSLREADFGFAVAPRLNAAGRLDDMSLGIACLLAPSMDEGLVMAKRLDELNLERRQIEQDMHEQALASLDHLSINEKNLPSGLCLMDKAWHQGVIGILAGRLKEKYHRPTIVFACVSDTELKGSARSIEGVHIRDVLAKVDALHPNLITKFGGHAMAAGLSIEPKNFDAFKTAFTQTLSDMLAGVQLENEVLTDGPLEAHHCSTSFTEALQDAGPWGQQFPEPVFDNHFEIVSQRIVGKNHLKLVLRHESGDDCLDGILFNVNLNDWPNPRIKHARMAYKLDINEFRGVRRPQLMILAINHAEKSLCD